MLVLPQHNPLELANMLASLDALCGGRLTIGVGVGWSEREFEALGYDFANRGARTDEIIELLRTALARRSGRASTASTTRSTTSACCRSPRTTSRSGSAGAASARTGAASSSATAYQIIGVTPDEAGPVIERLRRDRPEPTFPISLRTGWDPQGMEPERIRAELDAYEAAGVQHVVSAPWRTNLDDWLRSMDLLAESSVGLTGES